MSFNGKYFQSESWTNTDGMVLHICFSKLKQWSVYNLYIETILPAKNAWQIKLNIVYF